MGPGHSVALMMVRWAPRSGAVPATIMREPEARPSGRRAAHRQGVDPQRRLADADRHALAVLAAGADAGVERHVVAHHADLGQRLGTGADQRGALDWRAELAVLDQVAFGDGEHELARHDVDLAAAEIGAVE